MKKSIYRSAIIALLAIAPLQAQEYQEMISKGGYTVQQIQQSAKNYFDIAGKGKGTGYKQFKRWEYNALRLQDQNGELKSNLFYFEELERYNSELNAKNSNNTNSSWIEHGPKQYEATTGWNPGVGRITSIAIDANDENHIIVGSQTGGVWKTIDRGANWTPLTDNHNNMRVYALAMDPTNSSTYYWGSSNGVIYKSTDAGSTWNVHSSDVNGDINKILIHPTDSDIMFLSAQFGGLYKSTDGGINWTKFGVDSDGYDIEFKPGDLNTIYASGTNVYRSTDGGNNFSVVSGFGRGPKMIGVSEAIPDKVFVLESVAPRGRFNEIYKSEDSGASFTAMGHTKNYFGYDTNGADTSGQAPRDMDIAISSTNGDEIHIAGVNTWRSTDGGNTFTISSQWMPSTTQALGIGYCHADVDLLVYAHGKLFAGTDGGIFVANNPSVMSTDYYTDLTNGLGIRQFYKIGISQTDEVIVTGGAQDNGTSFYIENQGWKDWLGADGMESFVDKDDTKVMYGTVQFGGLYKTFNGGNNISGLPSPDNKRGNWVTPFEQDPIETDVVYTGYNQVYKSEDGGVNWNAISQNFGVNLDDLKIAKSDNNIMFTSYGQNLYKTNDGGATIWALNNVFPGRINDIAIHPSNPNKVAVAVAALSKVMISNDGGTTWNAVTAGLPDFSALCLTWEDNGNNGLYLGMNYGVYYIDDRLSAWESFSNGIPNVIVNELEINTVENRIYAGTYGRGLWSSPVYNTTLAVEEHALYNSLDIYPNPSTNEINVKWDQGFDVELRIFDINGKLIHFERNQKLDELKKIDISSFNSGFYFLRINSETGIATRKFIKK